MNPPAIRVEQLGKQYHIGERRAAYRTLRESLTGIFRRGPSRSASDDTFWALRGVNFEVQSGEVVGVIGRNGAGKSTLLKVLSRITEPSEGYVEIRGRVGSLLEVGTGFHAELTGRENIYLSGAILGMRRYETDRRFDEIVAFSEVEKFIDTPVKHYSSGMYLRLAFAVAAHLDPEILLVDEVLAVGDASFQKKCLNKMQDVAKRGQTVLFVSHNLEAVLNLCSRTIVMWKGQVAFDGTPQDGVQTYHKMAQAGDNLEDHVIYAEPEAEKRRPIRITRIEMLDGAGNPKSAVYTWDEILFRIHLHCETSVPGGSIVFDIRDYKDQRLVVLDSGVRFPITQGDYYVDCFVPRLDLSGGEFWVVAGISSSASANWVWKQVGLGMVRVFGRDVYDLGRPPVYARMAMVTPCQWTGPRSQAEVSAAAASGGEEANH